MMKMNTKMFCPFCKEKVEPLYKIGGYICSVCRRVLISSDDDCDCDEKCNICNCK